MLDFRSMAISLISKNPSIANNPQAQNLISVIQNGDSKKGEEIARNGQAIFDAGYSVLHENTLYEVPKEIEKLIA